MNLHLENFNKLETRDRWTATVFTSSSSVVQIILTNSARDAGHFPTPRFGHFPTPKKSADPGRRKGERVRAERLSNTNTNTTLEAG
jgi:hypothetical protein